MLNEPRGFGADEQETAWFARSYDERTTGNSINVNTLLQNDLWTG
jgi:hypothetical protein